MRMNERVYERKRERGREIRTWPDTRGKCAAGKVAKTWQQAGAKKVKRVWGMKRGEGGSVV